MAKVSPGQVNFSGGEFSPLMFGRVDLDRYSTAVETCENYIPLVQGGVTRRPGTRYVYGVKTNSKATRLVAFEFSTTQAYILEFGDQYIRFYRDNGVILSGGSPYEISSPYLEADLFELRFVQSADTLFITHPGYNPRTLTRTGHTAWTLANFIHKDGPYLPVPSDGVTVTPSATSGSGITLTASSSIFASTDPGSGEGTRRHIRLRSRIQDWAISTAYAKGDVVINDSGKSYECTTAGTSAGSGGPTGVGQAITDNTCVWRYYGTDTHRIGWAKINFYASGTSVMANVQKNFGSTDAVEEWQLGLWSGATDGWPAVATFHEDRLCFAGAAANTQRVDMSRTGDYTNFAPTDYDEVIVDSHAINATLVSNTVNVVRWLASDEKGLLVGTAGGEWVLRPFDTAQGLAPSNVSAKPISAYGSADIEPVVAGKAVVLVQRSGRKVRELRYFFREDGFDAPDLTQLAEHVTRSPFESVARMRDPQSLLFFARADGVLAAMTYEREGDTLRLGWHRHILGGPSSAGGADAVVESIAAIPSTDGSVTELWMVVKRYIDGGVVRYVEYMTPLFEDTVAQEDAVHLDCSLTYDGAATDTLTGLDHLEGETVSVYADGAVHPDVTVASGSVTLNADASVVTIGYGYNSDLKLLRIEAGAENGIALGKTRRIHRLGLLLHRALGVKIGPSFSDLDTVVFRTSNDTMGAAPALFTGVLSETFPAGYDTENQVCIRQDGPFPGTILAVMPQMATQDR